MYWATHCVRVGMDVLGNPLCESGDGCIGQPICKSGDGCIGQPNVGHICARCIQGLSLKLEGQEPPRYLCPMNYIDIKQLKIYSIPGRRFA